MNRILEFFRRILEFIYFCFIMALAGFIAVLGGIWFLITEIGPACLIGLLDLAFCLLDDD